MTQRVFTPYELNQLLRHGIDPKTVEQDERPVEYITGVVPFVGREFIVTGETLIPRVETESLAQRLVTELQQSSLAHLTLADVGTGCGAIGLTLAWEATKQGKSIQAWLSDISPTAVDVAHRNLAKLSAEEPAYIPQHCEIFVSDLLAAYPADGTFDVMVANLPYIPSERISYLDRSVVDHEPHLALDGGPEGLTLIHSFLEQAIPRLNPSGAIWLEVDYTHSLAEVAGQWLGNTLKGEMIIDEFSRNRFIHLTKTA